MNKVSEIISMPVISLYEGEYIGIINKMFFDYTTKRCKYICILNDDSNIPQVIKVNDVYCKGHDCVFIKNKSVLELESNYENDIKKCASPINCSIFTLDGKNMGIIKDVILTSNYQIDSLLTNNNIKICKDKIFNIGKDTVIIKDNKKILLSRFKPQENIVKTNIIEQKIQMLETKHQPQEQTTPYSNKIITDVRFLLGRILNKDIIAYNGEIIAKTGTTISKEIINKASNYGKLIEVARYSNKEKISTF